MSLSTTSEILLLEEKLLNFIDTEIPNATDDELFSGGYLRGHISLAAADCEFENISELEIFVQRIESNIEQAKNELSPADQCLVLKMWTKLKGLL